MSTPGPAREHRLQAIVTISVFCSLVLAAVLFTGSGTASERSSETSGITEKPTSQHPVALRPGAGHAKPRVNPWSTDKGSPGKTLITSMSQKVSPAGTQKDTYVSEAIQDVVPSEFNGDLANLPKQ